MEAGNKGAAGKARRPSAFNIVLPHEQSPNAFVTPELSFNFHYFAIRKMHFLKRAKAITVFPGGFGTLDELFEALTMIQTGRMSRVPLILFGEASGARSSISRRWPSSGQLHPKTWVSSALLKRLRMAGRSLPNSTASTQKS